MKILISRTDNIGDVIFTLPMAALLKKYIPNSEIYFLGKKYTQAVVDCCQFIDKFYDWDAIQQSGDCLQIFKQINCDAIIHVFPNKHIALLAKKARIKLRIGTNRRLFHWLTCNKLVNLTRKNSPLHEAQLNLMLLTALNINSEIPLKNIPDYYGLRSHIKLDEKHMVLIDKNKFNLILHPKSKGSAREWSAQHYVELCALLPEEKFNLFITGTKEEEKEIHEKIVSQCPRIKSMVGLFSLSEFISFISHCDGLLACSTGPLHIAAALGKQTIGLYPPLKNMLPTRWGALGKHAQNLVGQCTTPLCSLSNCNQQATCRCLNAIMPQDIVKIILQWEKEI